MNHRDLLRTGLVIASGGLVLAACSSTPPPNSALDQAKATYARASSDPMVQRSAPEKLADALTGAELKMIVTARLGADIELGFDAFAEDGGLALRAAQPQTFRHAPSAEGAVVSCCRVASVRVHAASLTRTHESVA